MMNILTFLRKGVHLFFGYRVNINPKEEVLFPMGGCYLPHYINDNNRNINLEEAISFPMGGCYLHR